MQIAVSFPLDAGFLRRQCASCRREFKWHHGPTQERPADFVDPPAYSCPYCGKTAPPGEWSTNKQREYLLSVAAGRAIGELTEGLERMARDHSNGLLKMSVRQGDEPAPAEALVEPDDMVAVASPCHPWEPVKIAGDWQQPVHCLVCGGLFTL